MELAENVCKVQEVGTQKPSPELKLKKKRDHQHEVKGERQDGPGRLGPGPQGRKPGRKERRVESKAARGSSVTRIENHLPD